MEKRLCKIRAVYPLTCFQVPILGTAKLKLTTDEIFKCLCGEAEVEEILPDGSTKVLNFSNYNTTTVEEKPVVKEVAKPTVKEEAVEVKEEKVEEQKEETSTEEVEETKEPSENLVKTHEMQPRNNNNNKQKNKNNNNNRRDNR